MKRITLPLALVALVTFTGTALADVAGDAPAFDPSLLELAFRGIAEGNWFLVAGPALTLVTLLVRWLLATRWQQLATSDRWGVAIAAMLAGAGALGHALISGSPIADSLTLLGAFKVFVMSVATYVVTRKVVAPKQKPPESSGPGGPASLVALVLAIMFVAACGASAREKVLRTTFITATTAQAGFVAWDREHQFELAQTAPSLPEGLAQLDAYKAKRKAVLDAFEATYRTLAAAAIVDAGDNSLLTALAAFEQLKRALSTATGGKLP